MTPEEVLARYRKAKLTIAVAESCTGGALAAALTDPAGSSDVFVAGFVTYSDDAKVATLGVRADNLEQFGAVSEPVAADMAQGARLRSGADVAVSTTGIAGPGPSAHKPEGRVCFGLSTENGTTSMTVEFGALGRTQVRQAAVYYALELLGQSSNFA